MSKEENIVRTTDALKSNEHFPGIFSCDESLEYFFDEGCHIVEISNSETQPDMSVARARVDVGVTTRWHSLKDTTERYMIISGQGRVELVDSRCTFDEVVNAGDVVTIPAGCKQRITNIGDEDLIFFAVCTPRFLKDNYVDEERVEKPVEQVETNRHRVSK